MTRLRLLELSDRLCRPALPVPAAALPDVESALAKGSLLLEQAGVETARLDAECLLAEVLACSRWQLVLEPRRRLSREEFARYLRLLQRREQREPLAYLFGRREFWSLNFLVCPGVLVPRPETETLVEAALEACAGAAGARPVIMDLCTGSGAVAVALARELPEASILATDVLVAGPPHRAGQRQSPRRGGPHPVSAGRSLAGPGRP